MASSVKWLPVIGYEGLYEVSDAGQVRSLERVIVRGDGQRASIRQRLLRLRDRDGYLNVTVSSNGQRKTSTVHSVVARAFIGPRPPGYDICHGDGNSHNNSVSNLRYGTRTENIQDSLRHGTHWAARKTHCKHGHEFTEANTMRRREVGWRQCRTCHTAHIVRRRAARKQAQR